MPTPPKRINDILLGPLERPALQWLARHAPAWVTPHILTALGFVGAIVVFAGYGLSNWNPHFLWLSCAGFALNWLGDSLDGTLARYRNTPSRAGAFADHVVDAASEFLIFVGLGLSPYVRLDLACLALIGYYMMTILVFVRAHATGVYQISYGKFGPTEARVIAVAFTAIMFWHGPREMTWGPLTFVIFDVGVGLGAIGLLGLYVTSSLRQMHQIAMNSDRADSP
jgi:phosphatidylglycerophosphate synthase